MISWFAAVTITILATGLAGEPYHYEIPFKSEAECVDFMKSEEALSSVKEVFVMADKELGKGKYRAKLECVDIDFEHPETKH